MNNDKDIETFLQSLSKELTDPAFPIPRYHRLYLLLKQSILDASLSTNARLPSELKIAKIFNVSRITAKRALDELAQENLIERFRGKGSYVIHRSHTKEVGVPLVATLANLAEMNRNTQVKVIDIAKIVPAQNVLDKFKLDKKTRMHRVKRLRYTQEGELFAYYVSWTLGISRGFTKARLEKDMRLNLMKENDIVVKGVEQYLGAELAAGEIARHLEVKPGSALPTIVRYSYDGNAKLVDLLYGYYKPARFQYNMRITD